MKASSETVTTYEAYQVRQDKEKPNAMKLFSRKDLMAALNAILDTDNFKSSVRLVGPFKNGKATQKIQITRRHKPRKNDKQWEYVLTLGALNCAQRQQASKTANGKPIVILK